MGADSAAFTGLTESAAESSFPVRLLRNTETPAANIHTFPLQEVVTEL